MDCSMSGSSVLHYLPEFTQIHVHWVRVTILPSYPLPLPSLAFTLSQHQGLPSELALCIRWPKYWSFSFSIIFPMNIQGWFPLRLTGLISLLSKRLSRVFSSTTVQKHQFFGTLPSLWSSSHIHTWLLERPQPWLSRPLYTDLLLCGSQQTMENSSRDGNTIPPDLPPEKSVHRSRSWTWNKRLVPNR